MEGEDQLWKLEHLDTDHLFRHLTEVNQKEARGGYLEGALWFSKKLCSSPFFLNITLIADNHNKGPITELAEKRIHTNLLYVTRFEMETNPTRSAGRQGRRLRDKEPKDPLWRIELKIAGGLVEWWAEDNAQSGGYYQSIYKMEMEDNGMTLPLKALHLTVITPLQRTNASGIKIKDGLMSRKKESCFYEIEEDRWDKIVKEYERFFTKEGKSEMDRVCLRFDLHEMVNGDREEAEPFSTRTSDVIINTKSRAQGAFDLSGEISFEKTCTQLSRRVHVFSSFALPANSCEKEMSPRFVLRNSSDEYSFDNRLKQPENVKVDKWWFSFDTPLQVNEVIIQIQQERREIYIEAYRAKDKYSSKKKIRFQYLLHWSDCQFCCGQHPDKISSQPDDPARQEERLSARPGIKRRRVTQSSRICSPGSYSTYSPDFQSRSQTRTASADDSADFEVLDLTKKAAREDDDIVIVHEDGLIGGRLHHVTAQTKRSLGDYSCSLTDGESGGGGRLQKIVDLFSLADGHRFADLNKRGPMAARLSVLEDGRLSSHSTFISSRRSSMSALSPASIVDLPPASTADGRPPDCRSSEGWVGVVDLLVGETVALLERIVHLLSVQPGDPLVVSRCLHHLTVLEPILNSNLSSAKIRIKSAAVCACLNRVCSFFDEKSETGALCRQLLRRFELNLCMGWLE